MAGTIEFLCPNGHRIRCGEDRAGKPAKCPKCNVKFLIPTLEEIRAAQGGENSGAATYSRDRTRIQFLCPNGHRLFGSADLQGRPGQCPECGARFRIPVVEELSGNEAEEAIPLSLAPEPSPHLVTGTGLGDSAVVPDSGIHLELFPSRSPGDSRLEMRGDSSRGDQLAGQSFGELFQKVWASRPIASTVQIRLEDGQIMTVLKFRPFGRNGEYAAFIVEDSALGAGLVVIPWQAVRMIHISGLKEFPSQIFG
ncbi:hypothetical protein THTE_1236 [Thermogutta terrifontis]|jgi:hypothetical protein|uniref:Uncharacterized protein n=1 Tax=Thermogutta terrifontis TaxID=1331910 RepID=A0A286RD01_9BACT|nr:hypothetical protein [Thermogutta terrifontis]ASV73838.1 hypothetical protein THTE_1236 [Thermogutta terrifontis]